MILTITPSPSIDKTVVIPGFHLNKIHRPTQLIILPGGKGINVARAIKKLGAESEVCTILAGYSGQWIKNQMNIEGIKHKEVWCDGESRACLSIYDSEGHTITEIYETNPLIEAKVSQLFEQLILKEIKHAKILTLSGQFSKGLSKHFIPKIILNAKKFSIPVLIDTYGSALHDALLSSPTLIKINIKEAGELLKCGIQTKNDCLKAARNLQKMGAEQVVLSAGKNWVFFCDKNNTWEALPPKIEAISAVGSGDCMLAGIAVVLESNTDLVQGVQLGIGAGAANTLILGAGVFNYSTALTLSKQVKIRKLE
jgi:tagatose 6-phosphate kinase